MYGFLEDKYKENTTEDQLRNWETGIEKLSLHSNKRWYQAREEDKAREMYMWKA